MSKQDPSADIWIWNRPVGTLTWEREHCRSRFRYHPDFVDSGLELAPVTMPLGSGSYTFPDLPRESFKGLPGMLADALPDKFGNLLIDQWLACKGLNRTHWNPVDFLCFTGSHAIGALEFRPVHGPWPDPERALDLAALSGLTNRLVSQQFIYTPEQGVDQPLLDLLAVGTAAGGARAKGVINLHRDSGEVRSGQLPPPPGFEPWLIKFDGIDKNSDKEVSDPQGYGRIEYAYYLMARAAGIEMSECRLLEEDGRAHFITRRFERTTDGDKLHKQTLCALAHYDFNIPGVYAYETVFELLRQLPLLDEDHDIDQQYRRMLFNIMGRNQDDHTKNIGFLMDRQGRWRLSPAYDVTYSYNPTGNWTSCHQMTANCKRDFFEREDLLVVAAAVGIERSRAEELIETVQQAVTRWPEFAERANVSSAWRVRIANNQRLF